MNPFRSLFLSLSRMPPILMLFIILGLAVVVTMLVMGKMNESEERVAQTQKALEAQQNQKAMALFAAKDIEADAEITAEDLEEKEVEASKVPVDACTSKSEAMGQIAAFQIPVGQIVSRHAFKARTISGGFESKIKEGQRALTFGVDSNSGVAGFIAPGSHVDIIGITGGGADTKASPVMSDVEVIAVGTTYQKAPGQGAANPAGSVTVAVSPDDANKLIKAISAAKLYLTLRNEKDHTPVAVVDVSNLFPKAAKALDEVAALPPPSLPPPPLPGDSGAGGNSAATPPPPPPMHEIELWSGSKKEVLSVPQG